jgi:hypothetical protein
VLSDVDPEAVHQPGAYGHITDFASSMQRVSKTRCQLPARSGHQPTLGLSRALERIGLNDRQMLLPPPTCCRSKYCRSSIASSGGNAKNLANGS